MYDEGATSCDSSNASMISLFFRIDISDNHPRTKEYVEGTTDVQQRYNTNANTLVFSKGAFGPMKIIVLIQQYRCLVDSDMTKVR